MLIPREALFTTVDEHTMWIGTWNVNGSIDEEEVEKWIRNTTTPSVDVYVLGLEEMVPLTAFSILFHSGVDSRRKTWIELMKRILESIHGCPFQCLVSSSMVGLCLSVFVPEAKMSLFTQVSGTSLCFSDTCRCPCSDWNDWVHWEQRRNRDSVSLERVVLRVCLLTPLSARRECMCAQSRLSQVSMDLVCSSRILDEIMFSDGSEVTDKDCMIWVGDDVC